MGSITILTNVEAELIIGNALKRFQVDKKVASIYVYNRLGGLLGCSNMDGIRPFTENFAKLKAQQSGHTGRSTRYLRDKAAEGELTPEMLGIKPEEFMKYAGGVPVYDKKGNLLGGVGISSLTEDEDEYYAGAAINASGFLTKKPE